MTIQITNEQLLKVTFGDMWHYAHVCSFPDDPSNISNDRKGLCWSGDYYLRYRLKPNTNQFFCISLFGEEEVNGKTKSRRRKKNFVGTYVIGLDDVREKLSPVQAERLPVPTYKLKSSMYSEQWFYVLKEPETNRNRVDNLLDQLIANGLAPDGNDPGMKGVTRYLRLPEGVNTKAKRVAENGGIAPGCEVIEWNPDNKYTMEDLATPFNCDLDAPRAEGRVDGAVEMNDHPVLKMLNVKSMLSPGRYDITCPWVDEHTDNDDSGSAIFTNKDGTFGFQCHHGHCQERTAGDVVNALDHQSPGFKLQFNAWKGVRSVKSFDSVAMPDFMGGNTSLNSNPTSDSLDFSKFSLKGSSPDMREQMLKDTFVIGKLAILGQYTVIYAQPNAGKTLIIMREICNSILSGDIDAEKVYYINADDNYKGLVTKLEISEQYGFHMIAPGHNNFEVKDLLVVLSDMIYKNKAKGSIVILDTLKKFTDLMDKKHSSDFNSIIRIFISKGGTVIALAHVNKHKDSAGNSVHAGTTDVKDDCDCVYIANVINDIGDTKTIEFINQKSRGDVSTKAIYTYLKKDGMSYQEIFDSVKTRDCAVAVEAGIMNKKAQSATQYKNIIDVIKFQITSGVTKRTDIVNAVHDITSESIRSIKTVLDFHQGSSVNSYEYWQCKVGDRNVHVYSLNEQPLPPELPTITTIPSFL